MNDQYEAQLAQMREHAAHEASEPAEQGSAKWLQERCGCVTASRFKDARDVTKAGKSSAKREGYKVEVLVERLTGVAAEHFVTAAMQHGTETEPLARMAYERATGEMVERVGFIRHPTIKFCGGSPDGLIGDDGGVEFKAPQPAEHIRIMLTEDLADYLPQVQGLMWICDRQYWDFVSYCPMLPPELSTYIKRIARDDDYIAELSAEVMRFLQEVDDMQKALAKLAKPVPETADDMPAMEL